MLQVTREIITDVTVRSTGKAVIAKQNDDGSRFLNVHIQESGKTVNITSPSTVIFNVLRPDGSSGEFYGSVNENGTVRVGLTSWMLGQPGIVSCDISIVNESSKLTTMTFYIEVEPAVVTDGAIEEAEEYNVIVDLLNRTQQACDTAKEAIAVANDAIAAANAATDKSNEAVQECENAAELAKDAASGVVTIEQNSQEALRFWVGTKAEYEAQKDNIPENTFCLISDDMTEEDLRTAIEQLDAGKAPYQLTTGSYSVETNEEIDEAINAAYSEMPINSVRHIVLNETTGKTVLGGGISHCTIYKTTSEYGFIECGRYSTNGLNEPARKYIRSRTSSTWGKWDRVHTDRVVKYIGEFDEANLNLEFEEQLSDMYIGESRQIRFKLGGTGEIAIGDWTWSGVLRKEADNYATLEAVSGFGRHATKIYNRRTPNDGWSLMEWDNPPMVPGVEYKTTKLHNGKTVFVKRIVVTIDSISKAISLATSVTEIVSVKLNYMKDDANLYLLYDSPNIERGKVNINGYSWVSHENEEAKLHCMFATALAHPCTVSLDLEYTKT